MTLSTSFTAEDDAIIAVNDDYTGLEADLQREIDNIETDYPGYDEYNYSLNEISHNPFELAALLTVLYAYIFHLKMGIASQQIILLAVIAAIAGLISMVGDLTASAIKRNYDIKDYGHLIPGHGGIMDRFDSMIITAPIIFYLAKYLLG